TASAAVSFVWPAFSSTGDRDAYDLEPARRRRRLRGADGLQHHHRTEGRGRGGRRRRGRGPGGRSGRRRGGRGGGSRHGRQEALALRPNGARARILRQGTWEDAGMRHILIATAALVASVFALASAAHGF